MSMTREEMALINQMIEKVNRLERRLALQETIEGASGSYSNEDAQDAVGNILVDSSTIDFTYTDATPSITAAVKGNSITDTFLRDGGALSVIGRPVNSSGDPSDISASAASGAVLRESGSALAFGTVATAGLANDAVTNAKAANMANSTIKGRTTAGTGDPEDLTASQAAAIIQGSITSLSSPTITTPTIASFVNATHDHSNAAGGGGINLVNGLDGFLRVNPTSKTIATGAITATSTYNVVDTEAAAASDDLDTINGGTDGAIIIIRAANSARTVVIKDGTGNISTPGDRSLTHVDDMWMGMYNSARWVEIAFADNAA